MMRENFKESNYVFLCIYMTRKAVLSLKFSFPREAAAAQHLTQIWQKKKKKWNAIMNLKNPKRIRCTIIYQI